LRIAIEGVSYRYPNGVRALEEIDLEIPAGQLIGWIGANGAGKSTLARHLNGLLPIQTGRVTLGDWEARDHSVAELSQRVGYVFQNPDEQLFARTLWEEVAFGPRNLGRAESDVKQAVEAALDRLELSAHAHDHPYDLRPSQRRELGLASVLAMETPVLILDEPTTGQDGPGLDRLHRLLEELHEVGRTIILISHDMDFCADHAERVVVFGAGRILADDRPDVAFRRTDVLARAQVDAPQLVRLAARLGLPGAPSRAEELVDLWATVRAKG
jgi:energy-coupling factor transport system ATP-binding protein